jgi:serine/threonine-protein kinase HipA
LEELLESVARIEKGLPLSPEMDQALFHGSSIGGARPKALIETQEKKFVAKFSSSTGLYSVVKAEFIAMRLAALSGLNAARVQLVKGPTRMCCSSSASTAKEQRKAGHVKPWCPP